MQDSRFSPIAQHFAKAIGGGGFAKLEVNFQYIATSVISAKARAQLLDADSIRNMFSSIWDEKQPHGIFEGRSEHVFPHLLHRAFAKGYGGWVTFLCR